MKLNYFNFDNRKDLFFLTNDFGYYCYLNKEDFEMIAGDQSSYSIPGTFEIEFPEEGISLNIFLPYNVNIMKTEDSTINSKEMIFNYEEGDLIFNAFVKKIETNIEDLHKGDWVIVWRCNKGTPD